MRERSRLPSCLWLAFVVVSAALTYVLASGWKPSGSLDSVRRVLSQSEPEQEPAPIALVVRDPSPQAPLGTRPWDDIREAVLNAINSSRAAAGLTKLEFDRRLSDLGDDHCWSMVRGKYASHWTPDGLKPYHRYSLAGGAGLHQQNVAWRRDSRGLDKGDRALKAALESFDAMMAEKPPRDGHREAILSAYATKVGVGVAVAGEYLAVTHEFASDEVRFLEPMTRHAQPKSRLTIKVAVPLSYKLDGIVVRREASPKTMSTERLQATSSYEFGGEEIRVLRPVLPSGYEYVDGGRGEIVSRTRGVFGCEYTLPSVPGLYDFLAVVDGHVRASITIAAPPDIVPESRYKWPGAHRALAREEEPEPGEWGR